MNFNQKYINIILSMISVLLYLELLFYIFRTVYEKFNVLMLYISLH